MYNFFGAAISIISGHSVGREGPSVHMGATTGSQLGQWLTLPNNCIRTLVACGTAAAIAASFNTPLAGVIFAMEVVMMEYTLSGFTPVILAAVTATVLSRGAFGEAPAFVVPPLNLGSLFELPYILLVGLMIGTAAAIFIQLLQYFSVKSENFPIWMRATIAGASIGLIALWKPEVMGIGYDTVNQTLIGQLGIATLCGIFIAKLFATTIGLGFGLPGGLIGPTLVLGAVGGGVMALIAANLFPNQVASPCFYVIIGMVAMMGATLQAPLAALMAILELTANPHIILPGMLGVVTASLTVSHVFKKESIFLTLLKTRGLDYRADPVTQASRRVGITDAMNPSFSEASSQLSKDDFDDLLQTDPLWLLVTVDSDTNKKLISVDDIKTQVNQNTN